MGSIEPKKYEVVLSEDQRETLHRLVHTGSASAHQQRSARILLKVDRGSGHPPISNDDVAEMLDISRRTVIRTKQRFVQEGLERVLDGAYSRFRSERRVLTGDVEAHLIALACGPAPEGFVRWSLRLLADRVVELGHVETVSHETIRTILKKMNSNPG